MIIGNLADLDAEETLEEAKKAIDRGDYIEAQALAQVAIATALADISSQLYDVTDEYAVRVCDVTN